MDRETYFGCRQVAKALRSEAAGPRMIREECHKDEFFGVFFGQNLADLATGVLASDCFRLYPGYCGRLQESDEAAAAAGAEPDEGSAAASAGPWYQDFAADGAEVSAGLDVPSEGTALMSADGESRAKTLTDLHAGFPGFTLGSIAAVAVVETEEVEEDVTPLIEVSPTPKRSFS